MACGSLLAGMALANARLGVVHGIAHPLSVRYSASHGKVCGLLLPHAMAWNMEKTPEPYERLDAELGMDCLAEVRRLAKMFGLPEGLASLGVKEEDIDTLVMESMPSGSLKANPRKVTKEDLKLFLKEMCAR